MATGTGLWFAKALANSFGGETSGESSAVDYLTDTIKVALLDTVPTQATDEFFSDVQGDEVTGTNWSAGGVTLASKTLSVSSLVTKFDAADISVATVTVAGVEAYVAYKDTGSAATSPLLWYWDLDATSGASAGTLAITWDSAGLATLTVS